MFSWLIVFFISFAFSSEKYAESKSASYALKCLRENSVKVGTFRNQVEILQRAVYSGDDLELMSRPTKIDSQFRDIEACRNWILLDIELNGDRKLHFGGKAYTAAEVLNLNWVKEPWRVETGVVAIRMPTIQAKMREAVESRVVSNLNRSPLVSIVPSSKLPYELGYPQQQINTIKRGCSAGGFISEWQRPLPPRGLFTPKQDRAIGIPHYDRDCRTPKSVKLQFNGRDYNISCAGSGDMGKQYPGFSKLLMCDPLLFGFYPLNEDSGVAECSYPGMRGGDSGRARPGSSVFICDLLSLNVSSRMSHWYPREGAKNQSLKMAARLAIENPHLWKSKKQRIDSYCGDQEKISKEEKANCGHLTKRVQAIIEAINRNPFNAVDSAEIVR